MSTPDDLRPCPFCGGKAILDNCLYDMANPEKGHSYYGFCQRCATEGPWARTEAGAASKWNARAVTGVVIHETVYSPAALVGLAAEVERLRAVVDAARELRRCDLGIPGVPVTPDIATAQLAAWIAAEHALYAAVDALLAAQEGNQG